MIGKIEANNVNFWYGDFQTVKLLVSNDETNSFKG